MRAIVIYREDPFSFEANKLHVDHKTLEWIYRARGEDPLSRIAVRDALIEQRRRLLLRLGKVGYRIHEFPSSILNALPDNPGVVRGKLRRLVNGADLLFALGGDSTLLHASHLVRHQSQTRLVGINSNPLKKGEKAGGDKAGSFGGLLWPSLDVVLGHFGTHVAPPVNTEEWTRIKVVLDGRAVGLAMGDVFLGALKNSHSSHYSLSTPSGESGQSEEESQGSSGVLVATGAGSGRGSWHANVHGNGCSEFSQEEPEIRFVVREPFGGRSVACEIKTSLRPLEPLSLLEGVVREGEQLVVLSKHIRQAYVSLDANEACGEFPFPNGRKAILVPMPRSIRVIVPRRLPL